MKETWRNVPGFGGNYRASSTGNVYSKRRLVTDINGITQNYGGRVLKRTLNSKGYYTVSMTNGTNKSSNYLIHRIVAITFIQNKEDKPNINHLDGNPKNNNIKNLEWCTQKENVMHAYRNGLAVALKNEQNGRSKMKKTQVRAIRRYKKNGGKMSLRAIARKYKVAPTTICQIMSNKTWIDI